MKFLDLPPVWLAFFAMLAWIQSEFFDLNLSFGYAYFHQIGTAVVLLGCVLIGLAAFEFYRHRTTIVPHMQPSALIQNGIFSWTRNPIYFADVLILAGLIFRWDAMPSILLLPIFIYLIRNRFIEIEEQKMRKAFGEEFFQYEQKVRRWI